MSGWASELAVSLIGLEHGRKELDMDVIDSIQKNSCERILSVRQFSIAGILAIADAVDCDGI